MTTWTETTRVFTAWNTWYVYVQIEGAGRVELNLGESEPTAADIQAAVERYLAAIAEVETVEVTAENGEVV